MHLGVTSWPRGAFEARHARNLVVWTLGVLLITGCLAVSVPKGADTLPDRLTDQAFWNLVSGFSEEGGYFPYRELSLKRNLVSIRHPPTGEGGEGRRCVSWGRAGAELHLHCGDSSEDRLHHRYPAAEYAGAPDVQGAVRDVAGPCRFRVAFVLEEASRETRQHIHGHRTFQRIPIGSGPIHSCSRRIFRRSRIGSSRNTGSRCRRMTRTRSRMSRTRFSSSGPISMTPRSGLLRSLERAIRG